MKYYGVRWALSCHPDDFWTKYFTSSTYVADYIAEHGQPDIIEVRKTFTDRKQAQAWETRVLARLNAAKRDDYLNKTNGNGVMSDDAERKKSESLSGANHPNYDHTIYTFYHDNGTVEHCTKRELIVKYDLEHINTHISRIVSGKIKNAGGWRITPEKIVTVRAPETSGSFNHTIYTFYHKDGRVKTCTYYALRKEYNLNDGSLSQMVNGLLKSCKGWALSIENTANRGDKTLYTFYHVSGIVETCTRVQMKERHGLGKGPVSKLLKGDFKQTHGWSLSPFM
jgi:hypothetical protein